MPKARATSRKPEPAPYDAAQAKKAVAAAAAGKKKAVAVKNPLFIARSSPAGIGQGIRHARDLSHFVKWPRYVRIQRQRRVLQQRLKVPPAVRQFADTVDKGTARLLFTLADKYKPETKLQKKQRLLSWAAAKEKDPNFKQPAPPPVLKYGINHITALVEQKQASLVLIAHDVDPIEIVVWLPTLCRKMGIPYAIVKGKARLGQLVDKKTATAVAFKTISPADQGEFSTLVRLVKEKYQGEDSAKKLRKWGGQKLGPKARAARSSLARKSANKAKSA